MTGVMGVEPPGSSSMRCGGKSGVRLCKGWFRPLVGHPPLGQEKGRAARLRLPKAAAVTSGQAKGLGFPFRAAEWADTHLGIPS